MSVPMRYGSVVTASAGRDKDSRFVVVGERDGFVLICDGKRRPLERPKRKNPRHLSPTDDRLPEEDVRTNRAIRRALSTFAGEAGHSPS